MVRPEKAAVVEEIQRKLDDADAAVLTEYRGLTVAELAQLRAGLREAGTEYKVFKNTLARRAVEGAGRTELLPLLDGPVAFAFVSGDAVVAAKTLRSFAKDHGALVLKGGLLGERVLEAADVRALAEVEPREVLLAQLAGAFQAPLTKAAGLFQAFPRELAGLTKALVDKRVAEGEEAPPAVGDETPTAEPTGEEAPTETETETPEGSEEPGSDETEAPADDSSEEE